jgi:hypothetical protein
MPMPPIIGTRKVYFFSFPVTPKILLEYGQAVICSFTNQYKRAKKLLTCPKNMYQLLC